jgi:glutamate/aspartate transport system substrate-binding protein
MSVIKKFSMIGMLAVVMLPMVARGQEADGAVKRIQQNKAITIGFRESAAPFSYLDQSRKPAGYSIELCARIAQELGKKLKIAAMDVKYVPVTPQTRIALIANGTVDMECGTTVNSLARQQQVDFTYAVALAEGKLLVKRTSAIRELSDLGGKIIAVASGTTAELYVRSALDKAKISARVLPVRDNGEGLLAVSSQRADAFVNDAVLLSGALRSATNKADFAIVGKPCSFEQVGFMVAKNNSALLTAANDTIARMLASGEMIKLYDTWITPYGLPIEGEIETLFKIQAIEE